VSDDGFIVTAGGQRMAADGLRVSVEWAER
jgi:hypothetical protein